MLSAVPDARWRSAVRGGEPGHIVISDRLRYQDWIVEVFDGTHGSLISSSRFDHEPPWFIAEGYAAKYEESNDNALFQVYRVELVVP